MFKYSNVHMVLYPSNKIKELFRSFTPTKYQNMFRFKKQNILLFHNIDITPDLYYFLFYEQTQYGVNTQMEDFKKITFKLQLRG